MRPSFVDIDPVDTNLTGYASNVTGATWTLTATASGDVPQLARQVTIRNDSVTNHSAKTATLVGTDGQDKALTEVLNLPGSSATVTSVNYFKTLTSITPSATIGVDTMDIGWAQTIQSYIYPIDWRSPWACNIQVDVTGTINFTVQQTFVDVLGGVTPVWSDITALASKTADTVSQATVGATALHILVNSFSSGAELQMYTTQPTNV